MIYAIGDLHLSNAADKPMDVFGDAWVDHQQRIEQNWRAHVKDDDIVLIPGDISWAMTLPEATPDLNFIGELPGRKVMIRGNHDYWWNGIAKVRNSLPGRSYGIQNDSVTISDVSFCGTRGWLLPAHPKFGPDDGRLLKREAERLRLSLEHADKSGLPKVCLIHYPPLGSDGSATVFSDLLEHYDVQACVYGHLHGQTHRFKFEGVKGGVRYYLTSADFIQFNPVIIEI